MTNRYMARLRVIALMKHHIDIRLVCHFLCFALEFNDEGAADSGSLIQDLDGPEGNARRAQRLVRGLLDGPSSVNRSGKDYREARNWDLSRVYVSNSSLSLGERMRFTNWLPNRFRVEAMRETLTKSVPMPKIMLACCKKAGRKNQGFTR